MTRTEDDIETIARRLFDAYNDHLRRDSKPVAYERFEDQPPTLRRSGIDQARGFWDKAELLGCAIVRADGEPLAAASKDGRADGGFERVVQFSPEEIESLARAEHARWVEERARDGWTLGPAKDVERKVTPFLVPYDDLTEEVKEYDREPMRLLIGQLKAVGYALVRPRCGDGPANGAQEPCEGADHGC